MSRFESIGWARSPVVIGLLGLSVSCSRLDDVAAAGPTASGETLEVVKAMVEAHGGMDAWRAASTVSYESSFQRAGAPNPMIAREVIEQGARRAYADYPGTDMRLGWDGERAWSENWGMPYPPRFMALLNYYFLNLPWLTHDPGVVLGEPGTATLPDDPTEYKTVRMTFEQGVGDTPDDYYVLFIDPETHLLKACQYIVTYTEILPEGSESTPDHLFIYDELEDVNGLMVPIRCRITELDGTPYATVDVKDWSFEEVFDTARMEMPEGAVVDTSQT